jgi:hypothetical protein
MQDPPNCWIKLRNMPSTLKLHTVDHFNFNTVESFRTLQRFYSCLKAQENAGKLKRLFKKSEITAQLASCEAELASSSYIFTVGISMSRRDDLGALNVGLKMQHGVGVSSALAELDIDTDRRHQELLELISTQSASIDEASSVASRHNLWCI